MDSWGMIFGKWPYQSRNLIDLRHKTILFPCFFDDCRLSDETLLQRCLLMVLRCLKIRIGSVSCANLGLRLLKIGLKIWVRLTLLRACLHVHLIINCEIQFNYKSDVY